MVLQIADAELLRLSDCEERAALLDETADIWEHELGDTEQAHVLRSRAVEERGEVAQAPEADPGSAAPEAAARGNSADALSMLRGALERDPEDVESIDMLITILEGSERRAETAEWLERRAALADDETRSAVLMRLAAVREELGDLSAARSAYEQALEVQPRTAGLRQALLRLYRTTEAWTRMRLLLEDWSREGTEGEQVDALLMQGELLENQFEDPDAAAQSFRQVLVLRPDDALAAEALERLGAQATPASASEVDAEDSGSERAMRILGVLLRKLEGVESNDHSRAAESVELRLRIAELQSESLEDPFGAIDTLEPLLGFDLGIEAAASGLADLYESAGRFDSLSELAQQMAAREDGPERTRWLRRAAEMAQKAGRGDLAIASFERILDETPNDPSTERALQDLYRSRGSTGPLVALLRRALHGADATRERELHIELADHLEGALDDAPGALIHLTRAVELDTSDLGLLDRGLAVAGLVGGEMAQLDLLDRITVAAWEPSLRARLLARRATHLADSLGWNEEAHEGWQLAHNLDPECAEACDRLGIR
jgi:tetratricopeptide (TPR) repeat protein